MVMVATLVDSALRRDDIGLDAVTQAGRDEHLDGLDGHLDDVLVGE